MIDFLSKRKGTTFFLFYRYNVHEYPEDYDNSNYGSPNQFRPQYPGPYGPNSRPIRPSGGTQVLVGPDGPSGIIGRFVDIPFIPLNKKQKTKNPKYNNYAPINR